ncbi:MAG: PAS domain-containing protein [Actinomycetia bacterium]|nr:PAS domain-containing protein [Actinomycetes bacterium]
MTGSVTPDSEPDGLDPLSNALGAGPEAWEFFTALIESMPVVPYIDVPDEQRTLYIGPQAREILGLELGDVVDPHFDQTTKHVHPEDQARAIAETFRLMEAGGGRQEWRFVRPDTGETVWIEERLSVVEVEGRRLSPGVLLDITGQKRAEAEIAAYVQALETVDEISRTFTDLVVSSGDVTEILSKLAQIVDGSVVLTDAAGVETVREGIWRDDSQLLEQEVVVRGERWGTLRVSCARARGRVEAVAVDRATVAVALALLVEREASLITETTRAALVNDLVMERITSGRELRRRARALGTDLGRDPLRVLIVEPIPLQKGGLRARARVRDSTAARTAKRLDASGCRALVAPEGERVVAVVAVPATVDPSQCARRSATHRVAQGSARWSTITMCFGPTIRRSMRSGMRPSGCPVVAPEPSFCSTTSGCRYCLIGWPKALSWAASLKPSLARFWSTTAPTGPVWSSRFRLFLPRTAPRPQRRNG